MERSPFGRLWKQLVILRFEAIDLSPEDNRSDARFTDLVRRVGLNN